MDAQIVKLLGERADVAKQVGIIKGGKNVYQPAREAEVLAGVAAANHSALPNESLKTIYKEIISACRHIQKPLRVAFLGPAGTYCEEAARKMHGTNSEFVPCVDIEQTVRAVETGNADEAVVPIENSTEGSVRQTQDLLLQTQLKIYQEIALPIHHQLLTKAALLQDIQEVSAHPQALAQCRSWLAEHLPKASQTATTSNADAARQAFHSPRMAAIASTNAAAIYNLPILAANIEDSTNNTTRFVALGAQVAQPTGNDTTMLICTLPHCTGSLHKLLSVFVNANINLTKIESRPDPSANWKYLFYIQIDGHQSDATVKIIGSYQKADDAR